MAVSSRAGPISFSINLLGRRLDFREAFYADSKPHLRKMQSGNGAGEKSFSLFKGSVKRNIAKVKNITRLLAENSKFFLVIPKR